MDDGHHRGPGLVSLTQRLVQTGIGTVQNRLELFAVEWQEERFRLRQVFFVLIAAAFFSVMGALLATAVVIFVFPAGLRLYVAAGFALLYLAGAVLAWRVLQRRLEREPFSETIDQIRKDREWLDSLK